MFFPANNIASYKMRPAVCLSLVAALILTCTMPRAASEKAVQALAETAPVPVAPVAEEPVQAQPQPKAGGASAGTANEKTEITANSVTEKEMSGRWGIQIHSLHLTAGGYMLDFRYRVTDPEKAQQLLGAQIHPYLIDEATGAKFMVPQPPKVGSLRARGKPAVGKIYFIIFANPGKFIKGGDKVSVVIGDFKAERLAVE